MEFIIITGLSGAGKSVAMKNMEDIGYYCVDKSAITASITFRRCSYRHFTSFAKNRMTNA